MDDLFLLKIALFCSIAGIISLFLILQLSNIETSAEAILDPDNLDSSIKLNGFATNIRSSDTYSSFNLNYCSQIKVITFSKINLSESKNQKDNYISVQGSIDYYSNQMQIIADVITLVN